MVQGFDLKDSYNIDDLVSIMKLLRAENGCPWDREQTHTSIRNNLIEECYEAVEAIDNSDQELLREELGDVLMQVVFHSEIEEEAGGFSFDAVCDGVCKKLIHRHPHVFGNIEVADSDEVLANWDKIKKEEKRQDSFTSSMMAVSKAFPALMRAAKVQKRAAKSGFDYSGAEGAVCDLRSEIDEVLSADAESRAEEIGDMLFSAVNVARMYHIDPEEALYRATDKFIGRFSRVEAEAAREGIGLGDAGTEEMDRLWRKAKKNEQ